MPKPGPLIPVYFNRTELISLRRFLGRAVECAEGRCPGPLEACWCYLETPLAKIEFACEQMRTGLGERRSRRDLRARLQGGSDGK